MLWRGANSALWRGCCEIQALWWVPRRLGITGNMWRESTAQLPVGYQPPIPATPCHSIRTPRFNTTKSNIRGWDVVSSVREINCSTSGVSSSLTTCRGSHPHLGSAHQARCRLQPPDTSWTPQLGGVAHSELGRGSLSIQELRWYLHRLDITGNM